MFRIWVLEFSIFSFVMSNNVEKIKDRLNIVDVIGAYLKLEKAGANFKARCPFHNEKTPSFFVSPDRGTYKCFGCGAGGDIFTFVEQFEGVDFMGALKILAEKAGIELEKENPKLKNERKRLYEIMEEATTFFEKKLSLNEKIKQYLKKRGVEEDTIIKFRLGFAEDGWNYLYDYLKEKGFTDDEMDKVGLIKKKERGFYDRFRNRIIFPIFDNSNRVVAFSGRLYEGGEKLSQKTYEQAKYLNSPETVLFNKSKILYGYNFAKNDVRQRGFAVLVEGQMDIIMSHQAGFTNTVATSGTALTKEHLSLLNRLSNKVVMAFDGDDAGLRAANKGARLALGMEMEVKLVEIPESLDPADIILKDKLAWVKAMKNTVHIIIFNLNVLLKKETNKRRLGIEIKKIVLPLISELKSNIEQDYFISLIEEKTQISKDIIWEDMKNLDNGEFLENNIKEIIVSGDKKRNTKKQLAMREISGILHWQEGLKEPLINVERRKEIFKNIVGDVFFEKIETLPESIKNEIIFEAENLYIDKENLRKNLDELCVNLEKEILFEERNIIQKKINKGEDTDDNLRLYAELSKKIESF